jgi:hypothetical protein
MNRDWSNIFKEHEDVESKWIYFKTAMQEGINSFIPQCEGIEWKKKSSWKHPISKEVRVTIKKKHRLWTRYQETRDPNVEKEFKRLRNVIRQESRKLKTREQQKVASQCKENPKKFWQ